MSCISLTTDFGTADWFVGTVKAVILRIAPRAKIIDLTHEVLPGDVRAGAFALAASFSYFPLGTIHLAVVDPGVGTNRPAIVVRTSQYFFVAPDNGLVFWAAEKDTVQAVHRLENPAYFLANVSGTFHGRDVFAPVAAHLSNHVPLSEFGPTHEDFVRLEWPRPILRDASIEGEVLYVDRFGNAITNISSQHLGSQTKDFKVFLGASRLCSLAGCYQAVQTGEPTAVISSTGLLEVAINGGNAAERLNLRVGAPVLLKRAES